MRCATIVSPVIGEIDEGSALASGVAMAAAPMVDEADGAAKGLGYVADSAKADGKKYPKHTKEQMCTNCALFQGKATDAAGGCPLVKQ